MFRCIVHGPASVCKYLIRESLFSLHEALLTRNGAEPAGDVEASQGVPSSALPAGWSATSCSGDDEE
jgi:hypothetical protein